MRRPAELTPAWFVLLAAMAVVGGVLVQAFDMIVFDTDDDAFRWSGVVVFAVTLFALNVGMTLWRRRQRRARGLS